MALLAGVACGLVAALPYVLWCTRGMGGAIAAVLASFVLFHVGIALVYVWMREALVPTTAAAVVTFLAAVLRATL